MTLRTLALSCALALGLAATLQAEPTSPTDAKTRVDALKSALKGTDDAAKAAAVEGCGATPHAATAAALAAVLAKESDALRAAASEALGRMKGIAEAALVLHGGISPNLRNPAVLEAIFKALASLADRSSIAVCRQIATDLAPSKDPAMQAPVRAALAALGAIRHKDSVDALIAVRAALARNAGALQAAMFAAADAAAADAQGKLTGGDASKPEEFATWWKRHGAEFNDDLTARPKGYRRGGMPGASGGGGH